MADTHHHHDQPSHQDDHGDQDDHHDLLDLDAVVLHDYVDRVHTWVQGLRAGRPTRRVVDLGAGTGTGTLELAGRFPDAEVVAVDVSPAALERLATRAAELGAADRVATVVADLDVGWPDAAAGPFDLVWSHQAMHHVRDPDRVLEAARAALAPGGTLVVVEMRGDLRYLPDDVGDGLEGRVLDVVSALRRAAMPNVDDDWGARLTAAGLADVVERRFDLDVAAPLPEDARRYALAWYRRVRPAVEHELDARDRSALDALLGDGDDGLAHRHDLRLRGTRVGWAGVRPPGGSAH